MMHNAITFILISSPVMVLTWLFGGCRAPVIAPFLPWVSLLCAAGIFLFPQRHYGETWKMSVLRVCKAVVKDACFWVAVVLFAYLLMPMLNVGLCENCDWRAIAAGASPYPPFRHLPFCVNVSEHWGWVKMLGVSMLTAIGVRHGLTRVGKRMFLRFLVWNAAALSLLGFAQLITGAKFPYWGTPLRQVYFFSVFGYPNMAGGFFVMAYAISLGMWCVRLGVMEGASMQLRKNRSSNLFLGTHYPFIAVALNLLGTLATLSRAAIVLAVVITTVFAVYIVLRAFAGGDHFGAQRFRSAVTCIILFLSLWGAIYVYAPTEVWREVKSVDVTSVMDRVSGKAQYHTRVASSIMRDYPVFGVGGWGYRHFQRKYMTEKELKRPQIDGGACVHNDYMQFLAEHGLVGFALFVIVVYLLALPTRREWQKRARLALAEDRLRMSASTSVLFAVAAPILWGFFASMAILIQAFGDCPLRSGAVLVTFLTLQSASYGFFPYDDRE